MSVKKSVFQRRLITALESYQDYCPSALPENANSGNCHEKLAANNVVDAVVVLVNYLGLSAGSAGDFNLYTLLKAYLLDPEKRLELNRAVG